MTNIGLLWNLIKSIPFLIVSLCLLYSFPRLLSRLYSYWAFVCHTATTTHLLKNCSFKTSSYCCPNYFSVPELMRWPSLCLLRSGSAGIHTSRASSLPINLIHTFLAFRSQPRHHFLRERYHFLRERPSTPLHVLILKELPPLSTLYFFWVPLTTAGKIIFY